MSKKLTLIMCQGLPASGKSTFAKERVLEGGWRDVNKDEIREVMRATGWEWNKQREREDVVPARNASILEALGMGISVISSDTNFDPIHAEVLKKFADQFGAEFIVMKFPISVEEAVKRDLNRGKLAVGRKVIESMAKVWQPEGAYPKVVFRVPHPNNGNLMPAIICDLDGTLAHHENRRSVYDASRSDEDALDGVIYSIINTFHREKFYQIIYLSGRQEKDREPTLRFLKKHNCPDGPLWMRKDDDSRKDVIVKHELFDAHVKGNYDVKFVLDDRTQVVNMWRRSLGLKCLQCQEGDF